MTDHDEVLEQLHAALRVDPSRAFADGVRARVNRSRTNTARVWWGLAAAASIGLVTMAVWRPTLVPTSVATATPPNVAPITQKAAKPVPVPVLENVVAASRPVSRGQRTVTPVVTTASSSEPRLEVITNQRALLRELWAGVERTAMVETAIENPSPVTAPEPKPIVPIVLDPIVVTPIVMTGLGKEPGREGATPAIRRMEATKETR